MNTTFVEWVKWVASAGALGVISSFLVEFVKFVKPQIEDRVAVAVSILVAALCSGLALYTIPFLDGIPYQVELYWPIIVWAAQQLWFTLVKKRPELE